ncbi:uncharacterized protein LOC131954943 [Physella acuta]|uniref:uncharacterized protein LOC131954943 n=1 Tax=Physella acuta TaxID=109671 RepID=UPI0027DE3695|nr:uncharacterized protein LOC131954943 [Physella acuta]
MLSKFAPICRVRVNGGRNVLKESRVSLFSKGKQLTTDEYKLALDGNINDYNSFYIEQQTTMQFTFLWPRIMKQLLLYTCENCTELNTFQVEFYNFENVIIFTKVIDSFSPLHTINIDYNGYISKIVLNSATDLFLLEIQAFGDCMKRRYGVDCDLICSITCYDQDCRFNGVCKKCVQERTGDFCMDSIPHFSTNHTGDGYHDDPSPTPQRQRMHSLNLGEVIIISVLVLAVIITVFLSCYTDRYCLKNKNIGQSTYIDE